MHGKGPEHSAACKYDAETLLIVAIEDIEAHSIGRTVVTRLEGAREHLSVGAQRLRCAPDELQVLLGNALIVVLVVNATEEQTVEADLSRQQRGLCGAMAKRVDLPSTYS